jgi:hypothetical protein
VSAVLAAAVWALPIPITGCKEPWDADSLYYFAGLAVAGAVSGAVVPMSEDTNVNHVPVTVRQREMLNRQPEMITASFAQPRGQNLYA